jgi:DNA-directed RNA polymerase specialized sigma subunit
MTPAEFTKVLHRLSNGKQRMEAVHELECITTYQTGTDVEKKKALTELTQYHMVYLAKLVRGIYPNDNKYHGLSHLDLLQVAVLRFIEKLDDYDIDSGYRLTTFYTREIKTTLFRYLQKYDQLIPQGTPLMQQVVFKVHKIMNDLTADAGRPVDFEEAMPTLVKEIPHTEEFIKKSWLYMDVWCHPTEYIDQFKAIGVTTDSGDTEEELEEQQDGEIIQMSLDILQLKADLSKEELDEVIRCFQKPAENPLSSRVINKLT